MANYKVLLISAAFFLAFNSTTYARSEPIANINPTTEAPAASTIKGQPIIVTPAPSAKEVIPTPKGYINCFTVEAGWYKGAWIPTHRICQYDQSTPNKTITYEGVAWIEGYWACTQYINTACTKWEWRSGRWVKTLEVY